MGSLWEPCINKKGGWVFFVRGIDSGKRLVVGFSVALFG